MTAPPSTVPLSASHAPDAHFLGDPHEIPDTAYPASADPPEQLRFLLHYAVLAPSVLNTQPWRFAVERNLIRVYADRTRQLRRVDPDGREMTMSCGAALLNLRVAALHFHLGAEVYPFPVAGQPNLLAALALHGAAQPTDEDERLFRAIPVRRTNRHPFAEGDIPKDVIERLEQAAREEGVRLVVLTEAEAKEGVARLVEAGIRLQGEDPRAVAELGAWLRPKGDPRPDGVCDEDQGVWDRQAEVRPPASTIAVSKRELVASSSAVLTLTTEGDTPADWLAAGQALERVLLTAAARDLQASYVNQPVEEATLREKLMALVGNGFPQVVFRIGFPVRHEGTPRRHVQDVLFEDVEPSSYAWRTV
ncbi:MAG: nitroreductase [Rhodothermaceae bacterium]|nr:nitroreductase [Rhodothermaceae bacterium]